MKNVLFILLVIRLILFCLFQGEWSTHHSRAWFKPSFNLANDKEHVSKISLEKPEKRKEGLEETEKGKEKEIEAKDKSCKPSLDLSPNKQSMKLKQELFARFFSRPVIVPEIDSKKHSIIESSILQVFR